MPFLNFVLKSPRAGFLTAEVKDRLLRSIWFEALLTDTELSVSDAGSHEYPTSATVQFVEASGVEVPTGQLSYSARWQDETEGKTYSGSCSLKFASPLQLIEFLDSHGEERRAQHELHLMVDVQSGHPETIYLGGVELTWDPEKKNPLPITLHSVGFVSKERVQSGEA